MNTRRTLWVSMVALVVAMLSAWIAVGHLAAATAAGLTRTSQSLKTARVVAANTADSAAELQRVVGLVGDGIGSVGEAVVATKSVSESTRKALSSIRFIDSVQGVRESLEAAEGSLDRISADLERTGVTLNEAVPKLDQTVAALSEVPAELDRSIAQVGDSLDKVASQRRLWRLAIIAAGIGLLGGLAVVDRLVRQSEAARTAAAAPPVQP